jgi:predicted DNA-binding transcriptional regulator YafY
MSTNKHALLRYRVIDRCLRNVDRQWNWKSLAKACTSEIRDSLQESMTFSERTIKGDLSAMRNDESLGYYAPIEYDRSEKSYYYSDRNYSITEAPLNRSDSKELKNVISMLRQFTGFNHLSGIENIIHKLELIVFESRGEAKQIVQLEQVSTIPGQRWLDPLYKHIKDEEAITIRYAPFGKQAESVTVSPYLLKEYNHRWYLYAHNHAKSGLRTYGLERILELKKSLQNFHPIKDFNPDQYFKDIIGITVQKNAEKKKVLFKVVGNQVHYIRTKPLHISQKELEKKEDHSIFKIEVIPNYELQSTILSYGETIEILEPKSMINAMKKRIDEMKKAYA